MAVLIFNDRKTRHYSPQRPNAGWKHTHTQSLIIGIIDTFSQPFSHICGYISVVNESGMNGNNHRL